MVSTSSPNCTSNGCPAPGGGLGGGGLGGGGLAEADSAEAVDSAAVDSAAVDSAVAAVANTLDDHTKAFSLYRPVPDSLSLRAPRDRKFDTAPRTFRVRTTSYRTTRVAIPPCSQSSAAAVDFHPLPRSPLASPRTPPTRMRARTPISRASRSPARDRRVDVPPTSRAFAPSRFRLRAPTFESASPLNDECLDRPSPRWVFARFE